MGLRPEGLAARRDVAARRATRTPYYTVSISRGAIEVLDSTVGSGGAGRSSHERRAAVLELRRAEDIRRLEGSGHRTSLRERM